MLTHQMRLEGAIQDVVDERALAGSGNARYHRQCTDRDPDVHVLQVVLTGAVECDPPWAKPPARLRKRDRSRSGYILSSQRALTHPRDWAGKNDLAACLAAAGSQLHHVVSHLYRGQVVLDYQYAISSVA